MDQGIMPGDICCIGNIIFCGLQKNIRKKTFRFIGVDERIPAGNIVGIRLSQVRIPTANAYWIAQVDHILQLAYRWKISGSPVQDNKAATTRYLSVPLQVRQKIEKRLVYIRCSGERPHTFQFRVLKVEAGRKLVFPSCPKPVTDTGIMGGSAVVKKIG